MILASISELRERLNVADNTRYNTILASVLTTITQRLSEHLKVEFEAADYEDVFLADPSNHLVSGALGRTSYASGVLSLWLKGFNPSGVAVSVSSSISASGSSISTFKTDYKGYVKVFDKWADYDYLHVSYRAGYEVATVDGYPTYVDVNDKLKQACLMYAEHFFMAKYAGEEVDEANDEDYTDAPNGVSALIASLSHSKNGSLVPLL
ncbi:hypothetical protein [Vibrio phage vB_VhaS-a]|nr:hypothetical protein [Vibrio phage vB_VhaS-a]